MGHEIAGCLLVKLFVLHSTSFRVIFKVGEKQKGVMPEEQRLSNKLHIQDWIFVVLLLLQWHQWMIKPSIAKELVKNSHLATQWLIWQVAKDSPCTKGMGNNTITTHLALHLCEDILDDGVPDNINTAYKESAHIPRAKMTSRHTQKRAVSFTKQATHCFVENLAVTLASADAANNIESMGSRLDTHHRQQQHLTPWNDHAMVKWHKVKALLPALINAFTNLQGLQKGKSICICSTGQTTIKAGLCELFVHSFSPVDEEDLSLSNTLNGHYTVHCDSQGERPTLYLVDIESIKSATVGIPNVGWSPDDHP
jgi:hypothetical protein